eukprot:m.359898 g.359898  ORF g.359898 m.359898 type:complete len:452 (+) comp20766_c1_seq1:244-1599(+)
MSSPWLGIFICIVLVSEPVNALMGKRSESLQQWQWVSENVDGGQSPAATGAPLEMALDSKRQPHIFYTAAFELPHAYKYATRIGTGKWNVETVDTYTPKYGTFSAATHIAIDSKDQIHVLYTMEGIDPSPCAGCSSCVQCNGPPPPCCQQNQDCCDGAQWGALYYAVRSGGKWEKSMIHKGYRLNSSDARPMDCSLALDTDGIPHISYYLERPKMTLVYATKQRDSSSWDAREIAVGGYWNSLQIVGNQPVIVYQAEDECFCVKIWTQLHNGTIVDAIVSEGPNGGTNAQGYGISTTVSTGAKTDLYIAFTRNAYTKDSLRMSTVPILSGGALQIPSVSTGVDNAGRASSTSVAWIEDRGNPMVAYSWGTSDAGAFEVRTVQRMTPPPHEQWGSPITVNVTSVNGPTGGIEGGSSLGLVCCDAHGLPVLAYTRRLSMYESYLAFATMQVIS